MPPASGREATQRALSHQATDGVPFDSIGSTGSREVAAIVESLDLAPPVRDRYLRGDFRYHSCNAYRANESLSYLEVVDNTLFEVNR